MFMCGVQCMSRGFNWVFEGNKVKEVEIALPDTGRESRLVLAGMRCEEWMHTTDVWMHRTGNELMEFLVCLGIYMGLNGF
ncbi:unnamed protein product [Sphagnum troendelagicum]|uniref:Uncharacterized protein n=1 Tax=Sphagnum troendelagicum TaxID=128251 RepID=A0ABP0TEB9_9BRYO